jgi:hypothetical protein
MIKKENRREITLKEAKIIRGRSNWSKLIVEWEHEKIKVEKEKKP